ncbi:D-alanine--D-alanyl carrier protein ligase [Streptomyces californicus]
MCLGRVHQADEVVFGVPFLNRRTEDERSVVGQFANNLPVRVPVAEELPLVELAERVRRQIDRLREHERLPYGEILREAPVQDADSRRLFDVTASYLRFPRPPATPGVDRTTTIMAPVHAADALSVMVQAFDDEPGLRVDLDYADDVFDGHLTAEALAGHVGELLRRGLDFPGTPLGELGMLTDDEYEDVVRRHQGAPAPYPREKTLHELFAEQAARTPGQTAVVDGASGATLTFAELDRRADQVARALSERGAGPGDRVAILAERGPELLPGLLGILKAGAAYVPVDPGYPPSRVRLLLEDCGAKLVLRGAREVEVPSTGAPVLRISELYRGNGRPLGRTAGPRDVAYTIYTSGSTGRPKGVMVEHHAVVNRLTWMQRRYPVGPGDTLLQKTPISFDVSVWELLWWAVQGAAVVLLPPGAEKDPERIARTVRDHRISVVHFVPSMLGPFLDLLEDHPERAAGAGSLRYVFCSGEALPPERATQFNRIFDGDDPPRLVNLYGPTEAAVDVTYFDCPPASEGPVTRVPIGRPVENTTLYVLDRQGRPQPVGVPGELHIGGVQVARGYLGRPELTAERFVEDPFVPGGRLYRTGDLARLLNDGNLEYLGRNDDQVKIRGNRVELGEVQNALVALDAIRDAVVVDHRPGGGRGPVLVAYCTADRDLDPDGLRAALGTVLPAYMIPSSFERLDSLPLTPNGKVDRRALPAPSTDAGEAADSAPRTPAEKVLAGIWAQVLGVDRVGVHTDYFVTGGDSISMLRVRALAEKAGIRFTTDDFVRNPTVAGLAALAEEARPTAPADTAIPAPFALVSPVDRARLEAYEDAYPVTRLQLGLLFHSREKQDSATYKDVFRYSLAMPWREREFRAAFDLLVARHPVLRSSFALAGHAEPLQIVRPTVEGGLSVADLRAAPAAEAEAAVDEHIAARRRYDYRFDSAPLYHFRAFALADTVELVFSFHHAILDGGSVANLVSELLQDYGHLLGLDLGPVPDTAPPSAALHVAQERAATEAKAGRAYWRNLLTDAAQFQLESFRPHEAPGTDERVECDLRLPADLVDALRATAGDRRVPVKSVLFARTRADAARLLRRTGRHDRAGDAQPAGHRGHGAHLRAVPQHPAPPRGRGAGHLVRRRGPRPGAGTGEPPAPAGAAGGHPGGPRPDVAGRHAVQLHPLPAARRGLPHPRHRQPGLRGPGGDELLPGRQRHGRSGGRGHPAPHRLLGAVVHPRPGAAVHRHLRTHPAQARRRADHGDAPGRPHGGAVRHRDPAVGLHRRADRGRTGRAPPLGGRHERRLRPAGGDPARGDAATAVLRAPHGRQRALLRPFAKHLPPDQPFYAFQAAGADVGTEPVRGPEQLASYYTAAMRLVEPAGPHHLGGWSFGGFVAFEMARQLHAAGESVASVVLLDTTALNPGRRPWTDDEALLGWASGSCSGSSTAAPPPATSCRPAWTRWTRSSRS